MLLSYILLPIALLGSTVQSEQNGAFDAAVERDFGKFFETGQVGKVLKNILRELDFGSIFSERVDKDKWTKQKNKLFCTVCKAGVNQMLQAENSSLVLERATELCIDLGFGTEYVCNNLVQAHGTELIYIVENTPDETGEDICGVIFVGRDCTTDNPARIWEVTMPLVPKPPVVETPFPELGVPTLKVLHLADTHYDPDYLPGGSIDCIEDYLCCRYVEENQEPNNTAGFWGTYGSCDIPKWTLALMYDHIAKTHPDIDFIIWTGDIVPHDVWNTSRESNLQTIHEMADLIVEYFPGIPVYPSVGNHESDPVNQFPQPYVTDPAFEISWLYDELSSIWQTWLPPEAAESVAYSAYYSVQVRPGLKLLSVNTNFCYGMNWWLIHDSTDIANELELMAQELQASEDIGEKVYIIGHIPSGSGDCSYTWSHEFNRVVARYENTISGIFYGHTHKDHYMLYFDPDDLDRVYEVAYIGQSQTTYSDYNPGYKIYTIEGEFNGSEFRVLDHENWILNLEEANELNETNFYKLYSAKEEYGLVDLSPQSWYDLVFEMSTPNSTLFDHYYRNYIKASPKDLSEGCSDSCKSNLLCKTLVSDNSDHSKCDQFISNYINK